jgi:hypothetical protein
MEVVWQMAKVFKPLQKRLAQHDARARFDK